MLCIRDLLSFIKKNLFSQWWYTYKLHAFDLKRVLLHEIVIALSLFRIL